MAKMALTEKYESMVEQRKGGFWRFGSGLVKKADIEVVNIEGDMSL